MKALLIDHDDSFTENLRHWLKPVFSQVKVVNHRLLSETKIDEALFDLVIFSPGPKGPKDYPQSLFFLQNLNPRTAVYGVCLGFQMMAICSDVNVSVYAPPKHGKTSLLKSQNPAFQNLAVARYHSMRVNFDAQKDFTLIAESQDDQIPMWGVHQHKKWMGVQFHPESFLTEKSELHLQALHEWLLA